MKKKNYYNQWVIRNTAHSGGKFRSVFIPFITYITHYGFKYKNKKN